MRSIVVVLFLLASVHTVMGLADLAATCVDQNSVCTCTLTGSGLSKNNIIA